MVDLDSLRIVDFYLDDDSRLDHPGGYGIDAKRLGAFVPRTLFLMSLVACLLACRYNKFIVYPTPPRRVGLARKGNFPF
jgi:hypothetical protein